MIDNNEIYIFDYNIDESYILEDWNNNYKDLAKPFFEGPMKSPWHFWLVSRDVENKIIDDFRNMLDIPFSPRYIFHKKYTFLPKHRDLGTQCAINFLINCNTPAPIEFSSGNSYYYKNALLNTQEEHCVKNSGEDRLILKLSFKETPYYVVKQELKKYV